MKNKRAQTTTCERCVMDVTDTDIIFYDDGTCSNCRLHDLRRNQAQIERLTPQQIFDRIKSNESNFDCIIGLSGGVDSSYLALLAKRIGLRPLAIHVDNGWNTPEAVKNIENLVTSLNLDFKTHVLDWEEFRLIQRSFIKASVINIEIPTDHAINAVLFREAEKHNVKTILSGSNLATEAILPKSYGGYDSFDWAHIIGVTRKVSGVDKLPHFPKLTLFDWFRLTALKSIKFFPILNHFDYNKEQAINELETEVNWTRYKGKHCESIFTKFFQSYILPTKFNIDKRKAHLSSMIMSGMVTRTAALEELTKQTYETDRELQTDKLYFCKKLDFSKKEFLDIMKQKPVPHENFPSNRTLIHNARFLINRIRSRTIKL